MEGASTSLNSGSQSRQKRILPSRARRGGPGVGTCDADMMILETKRRQFESEPLIPAKTRFFLTTNPTVASTSSSSTSATKLNVLANERYFDRPEVLKAYREQLNIETPEFVSLGDVPNAGRLRARSQAVITEDGPPETSDAAYEKRHRKYETFEKRQRLREKEKLKHEQYKLKERMEQLRVIDSAAFLTLPVSLFPAPTQTNGEVDGSQPDVPATSPTIVNNEGERRRKEMLEIARMLEERYKVLLPPERVKKGTIAVDSPVEPPASVYPAGDSDVEPDEEAFLETTQDAERLKFKVKPANRHSLPTSASKVSSAKKQRKSRPPAPRHLPLPCRTSPTQEEGTLQQDNSQQDIFQQEDFFQQEVIQQEELVQQEEILQQETPQPEDIAQPEETYQPEPDEGTEEISYPTAIDQLSGGAVEGKQFSQTEPVIPQPEAPASPQIPIPDLPLTPSRIKSPSPPSLSSLQKPSPQAATPMSTPDIAVLEAEPSNALISLFEHPSESDSPRRPHKRARMTVGPSLSPNLPRDESIPPVASISAPVRQPRPPKQSVPYISASGKEERTTSALMITAIHSQGSSSRKAKRHLTAFGVKLQNELFEGYTDYEIPEWVGPLAREGEELT